MNSNEQARDLAIREAAIPTEGGDSTELRISANIGLGLIPDAVELVLQKAGIHWKVRPLDKNQLLPHVSRLAALGGSDAFLEVFVLDLQVWFEHDVAGKGAFADVFDVFFRTLEVALLRGVQAIVALAPRGQAASGTPAQVFDAAFDQLAQLAANQKRMQLVDLGRAVDAYEVSDSRNNHSEIAHVLPFTDEFQASAGAFIARNVFARYGRRYKALVVDCDNTLWTGECASNNPVSLSEANLLLQQTLRILVARGFLLFLASKNEPEDVLNCLRSTPGMLIAEEDVAAMEVGWSAKSRAIANLADRFGLSVDSFVFIDDDSFECAEVSFRHPMIVVVPFSNDAIDLRRHLAHLWPIDERQETTTQEDRTRTSWYRSEAIRRSHEIPGDVDEFLQVIELSVSIEPAKAEDLARLAQLSHRATQWNTSVRGASPQVLALYADANSLYSLHVRDRYGDYGIVGVLGYLKRCDALLVEVMALSCRALGKNVEFSVFRHFAETATQYSCATIEIPVHCTARNTQMRHVLLHCGFEEIEWRPTSIIYRAAASALESKLLLGPYGVKPLRAVAPLVEPATSVTPDASATWHNLADVALYLSRADLLLRALLARRRQEPQHLRSLLAPRTPTEAEVLRIWQSVLPQRDISVEDDFFDLQADSLQAVQILARVKRRMNVELPVDFLFEKTFSIATIAEAVDLAILGAVDPDHLIAELQNINAMSDADIADQLQAEISSIGS